MLEQVVVFEECWNVSFLYDLFKEVMMFYIVLFDVYVDDENWCIVFYFYGFEGVGEQVICVVFLDDGLSFIVWFEFFGCIYFRVFE